VATVAIALAIAAAAQAAEGPSGIKTRPVTIAAGSDEHGDWELFARRSRRGDLCVGLDNAASSGEGCGPALEDGNRIGLGTSIGCQTGTFAYGFASRRVAAMRVRYGDGVVQMAKIYKSPRKLRFRGHFFLAHRPDPRNVKGVRALDARGRSLQLVRLRLPKEERLSPNAGC
jgi:hypothetical protein